MLRATAGLPRIVAGASLGVPLSLVRHATATAIGRGKDRPPIAWRVGDEVHGFHVEKVLPVRELNLTAHMLRHGPSSASLLHIDCEDKNNVFSVAFRTPPWDSTGVFHILEHMVLCSSRKYSERDVFFAMTTRSLATFMNAWTAPDHTAFPFSTQNFTDYNNLMSIYLDAVFFPNLHRHDFDREGHRLQFATPEDVTTALGFQGVVFNEMKGALTDSNSLFNENFNRLLLKGSPYQHTSGGWPLAIPELTYEGLKAAHAKHYHPRNARFITYGDMPIESHLKFIDQELREALKQPHFNQPGDQSTVIRPLARFATPVRQEIFLPPDAGKRPEEAKSKIAMGVLANDIADDYETFVMRTLSTMLFQGAMSPFYKSLIDPGISSGFVNTGYSERVDCSLSVGLEGVDKKDIGRVEELIDQTYRRVAEQGIERERVNAYLHQIEFGVKQIKSNFGLALAGGLIPPFILGHDPADRLPLDDVIKRFNADLDKGPLFQDKIRQYVLENSHRATLVAHPDEKYWEQQQQKEAALLETISTKLNDDRRNEIVRRSMLVLKAEEGNNKEPAPCTLPTIKIGDIPRQGDVTVINEEVLDGVKVQWVPMVTNDISYVRVKFDIHHIDPALKRYVPMLSRVLGALGAGSHDYRQFPHEIESHTGGLDAAPIVSAHRLDSKQSVEALLVSTRALDSRGSTMYRLLGDVLAEPRFNEPSVLQNTMLAAHAQNMSSLADSGHYYAAMHAQATLSPAAALADEFSGLPQAFWLQRLLENADRSADIAALEKLAKAVFTRSNAVVSIVCQPGTEERHRQELRALLNRLPQGVPAAPAPSSPSSSVLTPPPATRLVTFDFPMYYTAWTLPSVAWSHPDTAPLTLLGGVLQKYLMQTIRFQGGAYGASFSSSSAAPAVTFTSYRDPNTTATLDAYAAAPAWLKANLTEELLLEGKLVAFASVDAPKTPGTRGLGYLQDGLTAAHVQKRREELLDARVSDVVAAAERYITAQRAQGRAVILGAAKEGPWHVINPSAQAFNV